MERYADKFAQLLFGIALILCGVAVAVFGIEYLMIAFCAVGLVVCIYAWLNIRSRTQEKQDDDSEDNSEEK